MNDLEKSRIFWEKVIVATIVMMFIGMALFLYAIAKILVNFGIDIGPITGIMIQIIFMFIIVYINKSFREELDRRLPLPKRSYQD